MKVSTNEESGNVVRYMLGKFTQKVQEGTPGAIARMNKKKVTVHELQFDKVAGIIIDIDLFKTEWGEDIRIRMMDETDTGTCVLQFDSRQGTEFLKRMENIDFGEEVTLEIWDNDYSNPFMATKQNGELLPKKYENEELPKWKPVIVSEKETWDKTDWLKFWRGKVALVKAQLAQNGNTPKVKEYDTSDVDDMPWDEPAEIEAAEKTTVSEEVPNIDAAVNDSGMAEETPEEKKAAALAEMKASIS